MQARWLIPEGNPQEAQEYKKKHGEQNFKILGEVDNKE
jgi:hypothetical protein